MTGALKTAFDEVFSDTPIAGRKDVLDSFFQLSSLLLDANTRLNLTRITDPHDLVVRHFLEAYLLGCDVQLEPGPVLDLGTGAGFPGLPLAVLRPDIEFTLVDSTTKKTAFVAHAIEVLGLSNAKAIAVRGEHHLREVVHDLVVTRAVAPVGRLCRLLAPVRHALKRLVLMKGPRFADEWKRDKAVVERAGFHLVEQIERELPGGRGRRIVAVLNTATDERNA